jgi:hypothetical protein
MFFLAVFNLKSLFTNSIEQYPSKIYTGILHAVLLYEPEIVIMVSINVSFN